MDWMIFLAAKSFLIAGGALLLLQLFGKRSAADRSWIAHLALAGLLLLPVATFALPTLDVAGPEFLVGKGEVASPASPLPVAAPESLATSAAVTAPVSGAGVAGAPIDWTFWSYFFPAALLFGLTLIAIARLFVLKARAKVLVDAPWLTALARAQQRMGFKHGTALLTSTELPSPISWGLLRPVILLNAEAVQSHEEAEAIITHELAHVARLDWAKLLLARVTVALFWFNPFVWLLAREAHQLREEAADDSVIAADIEDTDYARLLVGVARHECRGLLIGAHGVAPARNSLARRVKRVLDGAVERAPGGWRWGSAMAFFAAGMSVPVAALNLVPAAAPSNAASPLLALAGDQYYAAPPAKQAPLAPEQAAKAAKIVADAAASAGRAGTIDVTEGQTILRSPTGAVITIGSPDSAGHRKTVLKSPDGKTLEFADARAVPGLAAALAHPLPPAPPRPPNPRNSAIDRAIEMKAVGVTPEYVAAIRAAAPQLRLRQGEIIQLKAVGVTPAFLQELARLGYRNLDAGEITGAYAVGVRPEYIRGLANVGYDRVSLNKLTELRAVGVTVADIERFRRAGITNLDIDRLVEIKALGITPEELKASEDYGP